jgi:general L-amino acid transport system permease protein
MPVVATWPYLPLFKVRIPLLFLAMWAIAAPSFGGSNESRRGLILGWVGTATLLAFFLAAGTSGSNLVIQTNFIGGLLLTLLLSIVGLLIAFPFGVLLALGRTSTMPIFRVVSTVYIEVVRGVPLITILFFGALFLPLFLPSGIRIDSVIRALIAVSLFGAAYLAENVRGGLQAISKGQYEAAKAVGLNTVQMTLLIILPQALRAVIPALVGQAIAIFKDTSLVFIIGLTEILAVAQRVVPGQPSFVGSQRENLLFVAFVYWMFTFTFSRASQRLERKLGVGER